MTARVVFANRRAARRRTWWALLASLLVHGTAVLVIAWFYVAQTAPPPPPLVEEIEITIIPPPPASQPPMFVDTAAPEASPQEDAVFQADRDTAAASPDEAAGSEALPTRDGTEQPFLELEEQQLALARPDEAPPAPELPQTPPAPPVPPEMETARQEAEEPPPREPEEEGLLALAAPQTEPRERREQPQPPAPPPARPAFQRQTRPTRLSGSVSNRGRAAVASMATPLGRYRKVISDAIGSSWYHHIGPRMDIFSYGTVSVVFIIDKNGKVRRPRVTSNTSNESFEIVTLESILAADIPPIPPDILPTLDGGQIEIDYTFSIITN